MLQVPFVKRWVRWLLAIVGIALLLVLIAYVVVADQAADDLLRPRNPSEPNTEIPSEVDQQFRVRRPDGVEIDAWIYDADAPKPPGAVDTVLVLHGISDQKRTMDVLGRRFSRHGVRAVLADLRGHGLSSETIISFGVLEREDLVAVLDAAAEHVGGLGEIGVYGPSYGGAVAIQLAGIDPRVRRVVTVASFSSMQEIVGPLVHSSWGTWGELIPSPVTNLMVVRAGARGGFDPDSASPAALVADAEARFLVVHSRQDDVVPYEHALSIVDNCEGRCELMTLEDKDHLGSLSNVELRRALHRFLVGEEWTGG